MKYSNITVGKNAPHEVNAIIEISMNSGPIKYEFDKDTEALVVDRFMNTSMQYPCNYGFIPHTLSGDGDPADILVYTSYPILPKSVISVRPIGVLLTEDEKGQDEKILAVPGHKIDPYFSKIENYTDLPEVLLQKIEHFFKRYKDLENGKWVNVNGWKDAQHACKVVQIAIDNYKNT
ncbi:inorganic diphosphatase [Candidatus Bandiella euplotis]|uniref:Inorganic pyrophosphatase n=1 Tax=Candidatus Bandiella euplotis TaxID=1664265 RepID=A0ABZ0UPM1_9RICK|nr:inorganic diphosphatase [Candidatus Bandiella woodruffii]WPX96944.1 Inorganic pyrophosphatase [Candidatus Bandiella woodruffii]